VRSAAATTSGARAHPSPRLWGTVCVACSAVHHAKSWQALPVAARLGAHEVSRNVVDWPEGMLVEVRRCTCGQLMARKIEGDSQQLPAREGAAT
jgi:hypothetical protein